MTATSDPVTISVDELAGKLNAIFQKSGLTTNNAAALTRVLVAGERDCCKSHGIYRIEGALQTIKAGKVRPNAVPSILPSDGSAIVRVNADGGFANAAFELGAPAFVDLANRYGIAALVINDCTHFSALWPEIEVLADNRLAGLAMCPSYATVAPTGGNKPLLGTNPFAFGWPRPGKDPYVFDFATSVAARGEIELKRQAGEQLPEGWAIDIDGNPTVDPEAALAGAKLAVRAGTRERCTISLGAACFPLVDRFFPQPKITSGTIISRSDRVWRGNGTGTGDKPPVTASTATFDLFYAACRPDPIRSRFRLDRGHAGASAGDGGTVSSPRASAPR